MNMAAFSRERANAGPGNLFEPMPTWNQVHGHWRRTGIRAAFAAAAATAALSAAVAAARRAPRAPGHHGVGVPVPSRSSSRSSRPSTGWSAPP